MPPLRRPVGMPAGPEAAALQAGPSSSQLPPPLAEHRSDPPLRHPPFITCYAHRARLFNHWQARRHAPLATTGQQPDIASGGQTAVPTNVPPDAQDRSKQTLFLLAFYAISALYIIIMKIENSYKKHIKMEKLIARLKTIL